MSRAWKEASTVILAARFPGSVVSTPKSVSKYAESTFLGGHLPQQPEAERVGQPGSTVPPSNVSDVEVTPKTTEIPDFDYKLLMLERSRKSPFMPSAYVFPGGKLSNADFTDRWSDVFREVFDLKGLRLREYSLQRLGIKSPNSIQCEEGEIPTRLPLFEHCDGRGRDVSSEIAFRISAIRETFEETGVLLCTNKDKINLNINTESEEVQIDEDKILDSCLTETETCTSETLAKWRKEVNQDEHKFVDMCSELNIVPNVWILQDWNCWLTPTHMPQMHNNRRYDTLFYLACLPNPPTANHDDKEISSLQWATPLDLLCRHHAEELWLAPPQIYELCRLCSQPELLELYKFAKKRERHGIQRWMPVRIGCEDGTIAILPGDELYPKEPDYLGEGDGLSVPQSVVQLRSTTLAHHRFEFLGMHHTNLLCTESQTHDHLSPGPGLTCWEAIRDAYKTTASTQS